MQERDVGGAGVLERGAAARISSIVAMPVESTTGFPVAAQAASRSRTSNS